MEAMPFSFCYLGNVTSKMKSETPIAEYANGMGMEKGTEYGIPI